jgi:DNA repair protein RecO (recombination protein O)
MDERGRGLVLRLYPLTETSLIVNWLTPDFGRLATVAKGARQPRSPFAGKLDLFYLADFTFSRSRRSELHTLKEISLRETHLFLRQDLGLLRQASYCANLVEQTTEKETPLPRIYNLLQQLLLHLHERQLEGQAIFAFELKLLEELGLKPELAKTRLSPGAVQLVHMLTRNDWTAIARLKLSPAQVQELRQFLHGFLIFHLGKIPKGRNAAVSGDE